MRKPLARGRPLILHGRCGLEVQYDHGTLAVTRNVDMRATHGVGRRMAKNQINIRRVQLFSGLSRSTFAINHAHVANIAQ